jgi:hypothetical protein
MQLFLVIDLVLMLALVVKVGLRNIEQELRRKPVDTTTSSERCEMSRKFTAPSPCFALPCRPSDFPTYRYGITVKGLFKCVVRDLQLGRWPAVLYP